jgi:hypothetical protein
MLSDMVTVYVFLTEKEVDSFSGGEHNFFDFLCLE